MWRLKNMLLNNYLINNEIKEESKKYLKTHKNENMTSKSLGYSKSSFEREVYGNIGLPQEIIKISNKKDNLFNKWCWALSHKKE